MRFLQIKLDYRLFFQFAFLLFLIVFRPCWGATAFTIPYFPEKITVDGELSEAVWQKLSWHDNFLLLGTDERASADTRFKVFHNQQELFLAVECDEPLIKSLVDSPQYSANSPMIWMHDSLEVNLLPEENLQNLYKFIINSKGISCSLWGEDDNTDRAYYVFNKPYANYLKAKTIVKKDKWILELSLPFGALNVDLNAKNWRFNIGRNRYAGKKAELSASSRLTALKNHLQVRDFQKVEVESFQPLPYQWEIANLLCFLQKLETGQLQSKFTADVINRSEDFRICRGRVSLSNIAQQELVFKEWEFDVVDKAFSSQETYFDLPEQGEFLLDFELYSSLGNLLKAVRKPVELIYQPLKIKMLKPSYRNNIYASMPDKNIELEILLEEEFVGSDLTLEISGNDIHKKIEIRTAQRISKANFDASDWPEDTYTIKISGEGKAGKLNNQIRLRKLPYQKGEVWLDKDGIVHYDGKPRLPVGWYQQLPPNSLYDTSVHRTHYRDLEEFKKAVAKQEKAGNIIMYEAYQEFNLKNYNNWKWEVFRDPEDRRAALTEAQKEKLRDFLPEAAKISGILGWYLADEPEGRDNNPAWYIELVEYMQELDPYHPTFMLNYGIEGMRQFSKGCDILMPDCYPQYFEDGSTGKPRWSTSQWMQALNDLGKPGWLMLQVSPWPEFSTDKKLKGIPPNLDDLRSQFYQALLHNAKGITLYAYFDGCRFEVGRMGTDAVTREVRTLESLLITNTIAGAVSYISEPEDRYFQVGLKKNNDAACVVAVNTSLEKRTLRFRLKQALGNRLFVAGEERFVEVKNNEFSDVFAPGETHVYLTEQSLAAAVESIQKTKDDIAAAVAARKKPGNIIGGGEFFAGDYLDFGKGIFPEKMVRMSASSETIAYPTRNTGTLYYLLDGLIDPQNPYYSWRPLRSDVNKPWIELKLSEEHEVSEMHLYSGYQPETREYLLQKASVFSIAEDGSYNQLATAELLDGNCLVLSFPKTKLKNLRLVIDDWNSRLSGWLLTEIELY